MSKLTLLNVSNTDFLLSVSPNFLTTTENVGKSVEFEEPLL